MKIHAIFLALFAVFQLSASAVETHIVNCKLPNDRVLRTVPKSKDSDVRVEASYVSSKEILSVVQGDYRSIYKLITYKVTKAGKNFPHQEITFIVSDMEIVEGSRLKAKRLRWPFAKGKKMIFFLRPDPVSKLMVFHKIVSYEEDKE